MKKISWYYTLFENVEHLPRGFQFIIIVLLYLIIYLVFGLPMFAANLTNTGTAGWIFFFMVGLIGTAIWVAIVWPGFDPERFKNIVDQIPGWMPLNPDNIKDITVR